MASLEQPKALFLLIYDLRESIGLVLVLIKLDVPDFKTTKTGRYGKNTRARLSIQIKRGSYLC
jgi:hypothetical protein